MLAEITFDLESIMGYGKLIIGSVLALVAMICVAPSLPGIWSKIKDLIPAPKPKSRFILTTTPLSAVGSDSSGCRSYLQLIKESAPRGNPEVWWEYASQGLTEIQVSRAEAALVVRKPFVSTLTSTAEGKP